MGDRVSLQILCFREGRSAGLLSTVLSVLTCMSQHGKIHSCSVRTFCLAFPADFQLLQCPDRPCQSFLFEGYPDAWAFAWSALTMPQHSEIL